MKKKIIDPHRYKKVSRSKIKKKKSKKEYKINNKSSKLKNLNKSTNIPTNIISRKNRYDNLIDNTLKEERKEKTKEKIKNEFETSKLVKILVCVVAIVAVVILSNIIFNTKNIDILSVFSDNDKPNDENFQDNYQFNIGISKLDTTNCLNSSNVILNELAKKSNLSLVKVNKEYKIEYYLLDKIEKISDISYTLILNPIYRSNPDDVISSFNDIKNVGENNIYYNNIENIKSIEKIDENSLEINLLNPDPFFVYKLNFPVKETSNKDTEYIMNDISQNSVSFVKNNSKGTLGVIKLNN